jgi:uncharacterized RmlC-like cupin family protein
LNLFKVGKTHNVEKLYAQLQAPVWDEIRLRTFHPQSPHREVSDIWVRYNDWANFDGDMHKFNGPHESVWYPVTERLSEAKRLSEEVAQGAQLGAVLITKIPAGKRVYPHVDEGWHAGYYTKHAIQIRGNERQRFVVAGEELVTLTGDEFVFNNSVPHWVLNESDEDRITLIICVRREQCHWAQ